MDHNHNIDEVFLQYARELEAMKDEHAQAKKEGRRIRAYYIWDNILRKVAERNRKIEAMTHESI